MNLADSTIGFTDTTKARISDDARLIAAAPDLLAALEKLHRLHCGLDSWHEDAMADAWVNVCTAIAKAKGEA